MVANDGLKALLNQLETFVSTKMVIGEPIHMDDTILLPVVDVSFGVAAGGKDKKYDKNGLAAAAGGVGAKMNPSAILVIKGNDIRLVNLKNQDTVSKALDMIPDVLDRIKDGFAKEKENKKARKVVDEAYSEEAEE